MTKALKSGDCDGDLTKTDTVCPPAAIKPPDLGTETHVEKLTMPTVYETLSLM